MSVNSLNSYYNPYATSFGGNDFMSNATGTDIQQALLLQALSQQQQTKQPQVDTFEKSSGTSTGLKLAAVGGLGAGAGAYFFGDKIGEGFEKDGKFADSLLKSVEEDVETVAKREYLAEITKQQEAIVKANGFTDMKQFEAIEKYVAAPDKTKLAKEITDLVPDAVKANPDAYKTKLFDAGTAIGNIDAEAIKNNVIEKAKAGNLTCQLDELANIQSRKNLINGLGDKESLTDLIKKNPKAFGIESEGAALETEAQALATKLGGTKEAALESLKTSATSQEALIKTTRTSLNSKVASYYDKAANAFKSDAPEALTKAAKNFKWSKAGKWGAIAAGVGLVIGWIFK